MVEPSQFKDYVIPIGIMAIIGSVIVDFVGDHVKMQKKDEEFQITEDMMNEKIQEKAVTEKKAREIAKKLVDKELEDLEDHYAMILRVSVMIRKKNNLFLSNFRS